METWKDLDMYLNNEHFCALCTIVAPVPILRHKTERGHQCGRVRWGRAVTLWARSGITALLICLGDLLISMLRGWS